MRTLLLDADMFIHRTCASVSEKFPNPATGEVDLHSDLRQVIRQFENRVNEIKHTLNGDKIIMCISDASENCFRKDFLPSYKENRKGLGKPDNFNELKEYVKENYTVKTIPRLEADDVLSILATSDWIKGETVIVSWDKDFLQVPGKFYRLFPRPTQDLELGEMIDVSVDNGEVFFYQQILVGDPVDNYKGCPRIGAVKAEKLINSNLTSKEKWSIIVDCFEAKDLTEEDALVQARCARLLTVDDYDAETKTAIPWLPEGGLIKTNGDNNESTKKETNSSTTNKD